MKISAQCFATGLAMLFKAHGRAWDEDAAKMYYAALGKRMDDATFERVIQSLIVTSTYWPSPATILAEADARVQNEALEAYERVSAAVRAAGGYRFYTHEQYTALSAPTKAGVRAVGGIAVFSCLTERQMDRAIKAFVAAYRAADAGQSPHLLPPAVTV